MTRHHRLATAIVAGMLAAVPFSATAHHSMSEFNHDVVTEVEGVVSRVSWKNPHILLGSDEYRQERREICVASRGRRGQRATPPRGDGRSDSHWRQGSRGRLAVDSQRPIPPGQSCALA
jgi:hypothetical protein